MQKEELNFSQRVEFVVSNIPKGKVMTYGQIAAICGNPRAARIVGGIAHFGDDNLPWQRVVNHKGGLASGYPGGRKAHAINLTNEGIEVRDDKVDLNKYLYMPNTL